MELTEDGLALIRRFEGFRAAAYRCPAGVLTIGYGHTSAAGEPQVAPGMRVSEVEAATILARDASRFARDVSAALARPVTPAQFNALVSFAYNVGTPAFLRSSVLKAVNAGRFEEVPGRLKLWVKGGGRVLPGLERRRAAEAKMFMSDTPPRAGRGDAGAAGSIAFDPHRKAAGAVAGAGAAVAASSGGVPLWVLLLAVLALAALAGWMVWRKFKPMEGVA